MNKKDKDSENQGQNSLLNQMKKKFQELKERSLEVRNYLSQLNLDELSALTQQIGKEASKAYFSISMIVAELIRRAKENKETFDVELNDNSKIVRVRVDYSMSEKDEKEVTDRIRTLVENGSSVKYIQHSPLKNTNSELHTDVKKFQQELDRLKEK